MKLTTKVVPVPVVSLACVAAVTAPAQAVKADTKMVVTKAFGDSSHVVVRGKVTSARGACIEDRAVKLYHDVDPAGPSPQDFYLGQVFTDEDGRWSYSTTAYFPDKVYATAAGSSKCRKDRSPTEVVKY